MTCGDFEPVLADLPTDSFVYLDPPYMPLNATSDFTGYTRGGFGFADQVRLRDACVSLKERGIHWLESNSDTPEIKELYKDFTIHVVNAKRAINSRGNKRGEVKEVLISG